MQELDEVALTEDLPEHGLKVGDIGMVVHVYSDHKGYEVEFVNSVGELIASVSVYPSQIHPVKQGALGWPIGFFEETYGSLADDPIELSDNLPLPERDDIA